MCIRFYRAYRKYNACSQYALFATVKINSLPGAVRCIPLCAFSLAAVVGWAAAGKQTATSGHTPKAYAGLVLAAVCVTAYRFCSAFIINHIIITYTNLMMMSRLCCARVGLLDDQQSRPLRVLSLFLRYSDVGWRNYERRGRGMGERERERGERERGRDRERRRERGERDQWNIGPIAGRKEGELKQENDVYVPGRPTFMGERYRITGWCVK